MNFLLQNLFNGQFMINLNSINRIRYLFQPHHTLNSRHSVLNFAFTVMLNFVEIKYQSKTESPFETHPKTMFAAVSSLILYCLSYDTNLRISSSTHHELSSNSYVWVVHVGMALFGPLSLASLSSVLFPERQLCAFFVFSASILFSLCEFPCFKLCRITWNLLQQVIRVLSPDGLDHQGRRGGRRRRGRPQPASAYRRSRFSLTEHTNELMEQLDGLPV